jgi:hypothetical protein
MATLRKIGIKWGIEIHTVKPVACLLVINWSVQLGIDIITEHYDRRGTYKKKKHKESKDKYENRRQTEREII